MSEQRKVRRVGRGAVAVAICALLAPGAALASHQFSDVSTSNTLHADIDAIAEAGITAGCGSGDTYCPNAAVTRGQMAGFMRRSSGRVGMIVGTAPMTVSYIPSTGTAGPVVPVREIAILVPGASNSFGPKQMVHLRGYVELSGLMGEIVGCPCTFGAFLHDVAAGTSSVIQHQTFTDGNKVYPGSQHGFEAEAVFAASPGWHTYQLRFQLSNRYAVLDPGNWTVTVNTSLSAATFPFGPAGTNTLTP